MPHSHPTAGARPAMSAARNAALAAAFVALLLPIGAPIAAAAGVNLGFTVSPPNPATAAVSFPVTVHVQDDAAVPLQGVLVTLDIDPASNPGGGTLTCSSGTALGTNASGNAQFTGCRINTAANGDRLRARASGATTILTAAFDVQVGPAAALSFSSYPADPTAPDLSPQPTVRVLDAGGNLVTTDTRTITLSINKHTSTFTCTGGLSKAAVSGVAQFTGCRETTVDTDYRLTANDGAGGLAAVEGAAFRVQTGTATALQLCWGTALPCVSTPPTTITGGRVFAVQPVVRVVDATGNTVSSDDSTRVTLAIAAGTPIGGGSGTLACAGGLTERANNGVVQFTGCSIDRVGVGYRLNATSSPALPAVQSNALNVAVGPAVRLQFVLGPPPVATAGVQFNQAVQVAIVDAGGNVVPTGIAATVRLSLSTNPGNATLTCQNGLDIATVSGTATFAGCRVSKGGTGYRLGARAIATNPNTTLDNATSDRFNVLPAGGVLALTTSPANGVITWGGTVFLNTHFVENGAGKTFMLQATRDLQVWNTIATLHADANGNASFAFRPSDNRWYRAVFNGSADLAAATSNIARVVVRQTNQLRPTNSGTAKRIDPGTTVRFSSTVRPNRADLPTAHVHFVVYRLIGSVWTRVLSRIDAVDSAGIARLDVSFGSRGAYYVRSQAVPTPLNANSVWSRPERYDVR